MDPTNRKNRIAFARSRIGAILAHLDPAVHLLFKHVQGDSAMAQDDIVKLPDVKARSKLLFGPGAQFTDFELSHFVTESLAGPHDVTIDFNDDVLVGFGRVFPEEIDRLITRPAH